MTTDEDDLLEALIESLVEQAKGEHDIGALPRDIARAVRAVQPHMTADWMEGFNVAVDTIIRSLPSDEQMEDLFSEYRWIGHVEGYRKALTNLNAYVEALKAAEEARERMKVRDD